MTRPKVRPAVKAVVVRDDRVLLLHHWYRDADYFELPGGGQDHGETLREALIREVLEETGFDIEPGPLLWARDYISANHQFADTEGNRHQVEVVFACVPTGRPSVPPTVPDTFQIGTVWKARHEIADTPIYPAAYKPFLAAFLAGTHSGVPYLGDVN